jgi:hypothetical protein
VREPYLFGSSPHPRAAAAGLNYRILHPRSFQHAAPGSPALAVKGTSLLSQPENKGNAARTIMAPTVVVTESESKKITCRALMIGSSSPSRGGNQSNESFRCGAPFRSVPSHQCQISPTAFFAAIYILCMHTLPCGCRGKSMCREQYCGVGKEDGTGFRDFGTRKRGLQG